ncbi:hypothetical protein [Pseudomonas sp. LRF_L74]|uniref:hypothetical protein n=1 Tax=Pseudomonas sp. LRF_L74 TaxID=3369422 RepID=UPI003F636A28
MNTKKIFIIIFAGEGKDLSQSAMGFMYKYMMKPETEYIAIARASTPDTLIPVAIWDKVSGKIHHTIKKGPNETEERESQVLKIREDNEIALGDEKNIKKYRRIHENTAIIVSHGSGFTMAGMMPEETAKFLVDMKEKQQLPLFTKIVLDVCHSGTHYDPFHAPQGTYNPWTQRDGNDKKRQNIIENLKKVGDRKSKNELKKFNKPGTHSIYDDTEYGSVIHNNSAQEEIEFSLAFRFLNVYARTAGDNNILIAGYAGVVTAAHPDKENASLGGVIDSGRKVTENDGRPMSEQRSELKRSYIFKYADKKITALSELADWTDRI